MPTPGEVEAEGVAVVEYLVRKGLADDYNAPFQRTLRRNRVAVTYQTAHLVTLALKDYQYAETYKRLAAGRVFTLKMLDGALVQMTYLFEGGALLQHRLAFFPSPYLDQFQNESETYLLDPCFAEVVARDVVPFPIRFDYDDRGGAHQRHHHPKAHLTLGQYRNCRIPVTAPLGPVWFMDFILRNFYHTAFLLHANGLPAQRSRFADSIAAGEQAVIHLGLPITVPRTG